MDYNGLVEKLKEMLPEKIPYGELVGAPWPYTNQGEMVYPDFEDYIIEQAATAIAELLARAEVAEVGEKDAEYRMNYYKVFFDSVSKTPDCNTCADRQCKYRPKPGQTTRFNCPLWRGSED